MSPGSGGRIERMDDQEEVTEFHQAGEQHAENGKR
jgi:hypothetical protein